MSQDPSPRPAGASGAPSEAPEARPCLRPRRRDHWRRQLRHSLRWRLLGLFMALALGTTLIFLGGTREAFSNGWRELMRPLVSDYLDRLAAEIGSPPDPGRAADLTRRLPIRITIEGPAVSWQSEAPASAEERRWPRAFSALQSRDREAWMTRTTADGHRLTFGLSAWNWQEHPRRFGGFTLVGLLLLTALAYRYVRRLFRPIDDIRSGALRYGQGQFSEPIPVRRHDELGELATQVNRMAGNLQYMLEGQRGLLLAISHELRSPLTRARLNAELVAEGPEREALMKDLAEMRDLISDLLESERLAAGGSALQKTPCDLNALVQEVATAGAPEGPPDVALALDPLLPPLSLDRSRMTLLLRNLLDNARRHGGGLGIEVSTRRDGDQVQLEVRDHGPGVPPEHLSRLTEPFYRPDTARSRHQGGVGLGLHLCRRVAESHGGRLAFAQADPGLRVLVTIPA